MTSQLVDESEAAEILGLSPRMLQSLRVRGGGPDYVKLGRAVRYRLSDLEDFIEDGVQSSTSDNDQFDDDDIDDDEIDDEPDDESEDD